MTDRLAALDAITKAWDWRKALAGWHARTDVVDGEVRRAFHAFDVNDNAACEPNFGLIASCEPPNEGSRFCPACIDVVKAQPEGREKRTHPRD